MAKTYDEKINRHVDWGGDASTGNLPVKGSRVQEFIKDEFSGKIGKIYRPENGGTCYCFANEETFNEWLYSGQSESLVLDKFLIESKYNVEVSAVTPFSNSIVLGSTGNTIKFNFKIVDKSGVSADAKAKISFIFANGTVSKSYNVEYAVKAGDWTSVEEIVDNYISQGTNSITVKITGLSTQAGSQVVFTYNVFDFSYAPNFVYKDVIKGNSISIPYKIVCSETKYIEWYVDGVAKESDLWVDREVESTKIIQINSLAAGMHTLQTRAYVLTSSGERFYTDNYYYTFAKEGDAPISLLMHTTSKNIVEAGQTLTLNKTQFETVSFNWALYDKQTRTIDAKVEFDGAKVQNVSLNNGELTTLSFRPMTYGANKDLKFTFGSGTTSVTHTIKINVTESSTGIKETTNGMTLKLSAMGRSNGEENPAVWEYTNELGDKYTTSFSGFSWTPQQGWYNNALVMSNGATINVDIKPFINDWVNQGGTVELELETFDSQNDDAPICVLSGDNGGIVVTSTSAKFLSRANKIESRFKSGDRIKVAFIGNPNGNKAHDNLLYLMINGTLERAVQFKEGDSIYSNKTLIIGNPDGNVKCRLYSIRVYNRALTLDEEFSNYAVDSDSIQTIYDKNDIYDNDGKVSYDKIANKLPVMIFTGDMPEIVANGMDKKWRYFDIDYVNRQDETLNFSTFHCQIKLQGTSSLGYPRKNFKLKTKDDNCTKEGFANSRFTYDKEEKRLRSKTTGKLIDVTDYMTSDPNFTFDYAGEIRKKGKYAFRHTSQKTNRWTLKADYMESSCAHNTGAGKSWNDIFKNTKLTTEGYSNNTYKDSAILHKGTWKYDRVGYDGETYHYVIDETKLKQYKDQVCMTEAQKVSAAYNGLGTEEIRTAIDGFPMVCFYRLNYNSDLVFMGQYNFNNDKSSEEIFGFEDIEDPSLPSSANTMLFDGGYTECWEGLKNTHPISLFKTKDNFDSQWSETYESRYPEQDEDDPEKRWYSTKGLKSLCEWIVSTRHESGETIPTGKTIHIDSSFAKHINDYKYGYTDETISSYQYPETGDYPDTAENRQLKFETEKWEHFDMWKVAGYYVYLMRYGAVDQFVKNSMLTTEGNGKYEMVGRTDGRDGSEIDHPQYRKWYFINYDNDCLFGLRNNGELAFDWTLDRQTIDYNPDPEFSGSSVVYAMMGHESTLWNNLERDSEFMMMVRDLDNSMAGFGLNYDNMCNVFDKQQTDVWPERVYNENEIYKYINPAKGIGDASGKTEDNLWMLQGTRKSHRHWWIANHFNLLNAKWLSGDYKSNWVQLKTDADAGQYINMSAGTDYYYAWGQNKSIYDSNIQLKKGEGHTFVFATKQTQGDPVLVYVPNKMEALDFSNIANKCQKGSYIFTITDTETENTLKRLIIGNANKNNALVENNSTESWVSLPNLEYLDITNFEKITSVPIESMPNLHTFLAGGTSLSIFRPTDGSYFDYVKLPNTIATLNLSNISFKDWNNFNYTPTSVLTNVTLSSKEKISSTYWNKIVKIWLESIASVEDIYQTQFNVSNVSWTFNTLDDVWKFETLKRTKQYADNGNKLNITGEINLNNVMGNQFTEAALARIKAIFGENCFEKGNAIHITAPVSVFISCTKGVSAITECLAGESGITFKGIIYPEQQAGDRLTYAILSGSRETLSVEQTTGNLVSVENKVGADTNLLVQVELDRGGNKYDSQMNFVVKEPYYPDENYVKMNGNTSLKKGYVRTYEFKPFIDSTKLANGTYNVEWSLSGSGESYIESAVKDASNQNLYKITVKNDEPEKSAPLYVIATVSYNVISGGTTTPVSFSISKKVLVLNWEVIITSEQDPEVFTICYNKGWTTDADAVVKSDVANITSEEFGTAFSNSSIGSNAYTFDQFEYFTGLEYIPASAFSKSNVTSIKIPANIKSIGNYAFNDCPGLNKVVFMPNSTITEIPEGCFIKCSVLSNIELPKTIQIIKNMAFGKTNIKYICTNDTDKNVDRLLIPDGVHTIDDYAFEDTTGVTVSSSNKLVSITISKDMGKVITGTTRGYIGHPVLRGSSLTEILVDSENEQYDSESGVLYTKGFVRLEMYPANREGKSYEFNGNTTQLQSYSFYGNKNLEGIEIMLVNLATLGKHTFENSNIESFKIGQENGATKIDDYMLNNCSKLKNLDLESINIKEIGEYAISKCPLLTELTLPQGITGMSSYAVNECHGLTNFVFPKFVKTNVRDVMYNCNGLTAVTLPVFVYEKEGEIITYNTDFYTKFYATNQGKFVNNTPNLSKVYMNQDDLGTLFFINDDTLYKKENDNKTLICFYPIKKNEVVIDKTATDIQEGVFMGANLISSIDFGEINKTDYSCFSNTHSPSISFEKLGYIQSFTFNGASYQTMTIYGDNLPDAQFYSLLNLSINKLYVKYDMVESYKNYTGKSSGDYTWKKVSNDNILPITINGHSYITIYQSGEKLTGSTNITIEGINGTVPASVYGDKYMIVTSENSSIIYYDEPCNVYNNGTLLGQIKFNPWQSEYTLNAQVLLSAPKMATVSENVEFKKLQIQVQQLEAIINNIKNIK